MNQAVTPVTLSTFPLVRARSTARRKTPPSGGREGQSRCSKRRRALRRATGYTGRVTPLRAVRRSPHSVDRSRSSHDGGHDGLDLVEAQGVVRQHRDEDGSEGADGRYGGLGDWGESVEQRRDGAAQLAEVDLHRSPISP